MSFITNRISIGDYQTPYDNYDVIINLNYPYNDVEYGHLQELIIRTSNQHCRGCDHYKEYRECKKCKDKIVFKVGMYDSEDESENMFELLKNLIPRLIHIYLSYPDTNFLFHCYAGVSRSSTVCIAFLIKLFNLSLKDSYEIIKHKRPIINPNRGFKNALLKFF